ncbi:hypothetical protein H4R33_001882 [Dimargaris cristalligena]|nr:hypothetical protein H4R33_001882 [Dimargaris cristalligena]
MSSGKFPTFPMGLTGQLHFRSSPGLDLLHFRFHPAQHLLGQRIVRHLSQRDQFQLAQANRELRTPVTSAYQLCIPVGKDAATDDRITETVRRYRPYGRCSSINFHKGVAPGRMERVRSLFSEIPRTYTVEVKLHNLADWPLVAGCLASLMHPPRRLIIPCRMFAFRANQTYASLVERNYFSDTLRLRLGRIRWLCSVF